MGDCLGIPGAVSGVRWWPIGGTLPSGLTSLPMPQCSDGDTVLWKAPSFRGDVKPRSWLTEIIKDPRALIA